MEENTTMLNDQHVNTKINCPFTYEEVKKVVDHAEWGKAPGIDGLTSDVLKNAPSIILLTQLFNACLDWNRVPSVWGLGMI